MVTLPRLDLPSGVLLFWGDGALLDVLYDLRIMSFSDRAQRCAGTQHHLRYHGVGRDLEGLRDLSNCG